MYNYIKALHIIFVVTWFSGLFYIVRLFVYNTEAEIDMAVKVLLFNTPIAALPKDRLRHGADQ